MIAGEQKFAFVQQNYVTACVAWNRNNSEFLVDLDWVIAVPELLDVDTPRIGTMNYAPAAEMFLKFFVIGDIVAM
jgi:hypothetical protein